jgi:phosphatidylcholine synthase
MANINNMEYTVWDKAKAWAVHLFTATGVLTVFMAILAVADSDFRAAMFWLLFAQVIDGVDGTFARLFKVTEVLPHVKGKYIDFVIDFASYAIVPAYMIYASGIIDETWNLGITFLILLVSAVYYGMEGMVSEDYYFVGFPVMWNLVAFFLLFVFDLSSFINIVVIIILSILHFIPIKIPYPSRTKRWRPATLLVTTVGIIAGVLLLYYYPRRVLVLDVICWISLAYFTLFTVLASWYFNKE